MFNRPYSFGEVNDRLAAIFDNMKMFQYPVCQELWLSYILVAVKKKIIPLLKQLLLSCNQAETYLILIRIVLFTDWY